MTTHLGPTAIVAGPRPTAGTTRVPRATESLRTAVDAGLACLRNVALVKSVIEAATVEDRIRAALNAGHLDARGRVGARIACAHLAAGDLTEAYFALLQARDHMLGTTRRGGGPADHRGALHRSTRAAGRRRGSSLPRVGHTPPISEPPRPCDTTRNGALT